MWSCGCVAPRVWARSRHIAVHSPLSARGRALVLPVLGCRLSWMLPCRPVAQGTSKRSTNRCCSGLPNLPLLGYFPPRGAGDRLDGPLYVPPWVEATRMTDTGACRLLLLRPPKPQVFPPDHVVDLVSPRATCPHNDQMRWRMNVDQRGIPSLCMRARAVRRERTCHSLHDSVACLLRCIICL